MREPPGTGAGAPTADPPENVLLESPGGPRACADLLSSDPLPETNLLVVGFPGRLDDRLAALESRLDARPSSVGIVDCGGRWDGRPGVPDGAEDVSVRALSDPRNLTKLGMRITDLLEEWDGDGRRTALCFDSLTALVDRTSPKRAYQFLAVLTRQIETAGGVAHYHLDPTEHDERTVNALRRPFDALVTVGDDGEPRVRRR